MDIKDKVIIITGGSSGIGLEAAKQLAQQGARVVIAAPANHLKEAAANIPAALAIETDMTDKASVRNMVAETYKKLGRIDILVNNAGRGYEGPLELIEADKFLYLFRLHVTGPLVAMQSVLPIMRKQGSGRIVNVSTPTAKMPMPDLGAYSTTKAALRYMSLVARKEFKKDGIVVSVFYPFITASGFGKNVFVTSAGKVMQQKAANMPDPDTPTFTASRMVAAIKSNKAEFEARSDFHFLVGLVKKKLQRSKA